MNQENPTQVLERLLEKHQESIKSLAEQQATLRSDFERRHSELLEQIGQPSTPMRKDMWDRLHALAPITSAMIIACTGAVFTYAYNQQQLKVQEIQTIERFFPHLVGDDKSKRAAILAMGSLGNARLAAKVASIFASEGTASALSSMAKSSNDEDKDTIRDALYKTLDALAEKYRTENKPETAVETYRRAVALKESMVGAQSPDLANSLDRLADLCDAHGDHNSAEEARARATAIKRHLTKDSGSAAEAASLTDNKDEMKEPGKQAEAPSANGEEESHAADNAHPQSEAARPEIER